MYDAFDGCFGIRRFLNLPQQGIELPRARLSSTLSFLRYMCRLVIANACRETDLQGKNVPEFDF